MLNQLKTKTKIGLILILVGTIIFVPAMVAYLIYFPNYSLSVLLIVCTTILGTGINFTYVDLSQRSKGIMLNIIGIALTGLTTLIIFLIDI